MAASYERDASCCLCHLVGFYWPLMYDPYTLAGVELKKIILLALSEPIVFLKRMDVPCMTGLLYLFVLCVSVASLL